MSGHSIEDIRAALLTIHRVASGQSDRAYMSIPADPRRDADLVLSAAIDELESLRAEVLRLDHQRTTYASQRDAALSKVGALEMLRDELVAALKVANRALSHPHPHHRIDAEQHEAQVLTHEAIKRAEGGGQ